MCNITKATDYIPYTMVPCLRNTLRLQETTCTAYVSACDGGLAVRRTGVAGGVACAQLGAKRRGAPKSRSCGKLVKRYVERKTTECVPHSQMAHIKRKAQRFA